MDEMSAQEFNSNNGFDEPYEATWITEPTGRFLRFIQATDAAVTKDQSTKKIASAFLPHWIDITNSDFEIDIDPSTEFQTHLPGEPKTRNLIGSLKLDDKATRSDPRTVLSRVSSFLGDQLQIDELQMNVGAELEYRLFQEVEFSTEIDHQVVNLQTPKSRKNKDKKINYHSDIDPKFHLSPNSDFFYSLRADLDRHLKIAGIRNQDTSVEVGFGQGEISVPHSSPLLAADRVQIAKHIAKQVALDHGYYLTFMPMPLNFRDPSGMHIHISLTSGSQDVLFTKDGKLSDYGEHALAGILNHKQALCALLCPSLNSYCRLNYLYNAGSNAGFGMGNRGAFVRIPFTADNTIRRLEVRFGDCTSNPYFAIAACLLAILDGIENKLELESEQLEYKHPSGYFELSNRSPDALPKDLEAAIIHLVEDQAFLQRDGLFSELTLKKHISDLTQQVLVRATQPHPMDFINTFGA